MADSTHVRTDFRAKYWQKYRQSQILAKVQAVRTLPAGKSSDQSVVEEGIEEKIVVFNLVEENPCWCWE